MTPDKQAERACAVPLVDRLRNVPEKAQYSLDVGKYETRYWPVGALCHDAADAISHLSGAQKDMVTAAAEAPAVTDELLHRLAQQLWEQGHISDLSRTTAAIFGRAVLATFAAQPKAGSTEAKPLPELVVTRNGKVLTDQKRGIAEFLEQCTPSDATDNWKQYAKEGETAQDVIERERKDNEALLTMLAKERASTEAPEVSDADPDGDESRKGFRDLDTQMRVRDLTAWQVWREAVRWAFALRPKAQPLTGELRAKATKMAYAGWTDVGISVNSLQLVLREVLDGIASTTKDGNHG